MSPGHIYGPKRSEKKKNTETEESEEEIIKYEMIGGKQKTFKNTRFTLKNEDLMQP